MKRISPINWQTFGHRRQKGLLEKLFSANEARGFYVFSGPANVGKTAIALELAAALVCMDQTPGGTRPCLACQACRLSQSINPDLEVIDGGQEIKIANVREVLKKFVLKSFLSGRRALVIGMGENLNLESANALLKFLEEPDSRMSIFIATSRPDALPKTVLSRARRIYFGIPDQAAVEEFYSSYADLPKSIVVAVKNFCAWRLGLARQALASANAAENFVASMKNFYEVLEGDVLRRLEFGSELAEKESGELASELVRWLACLYNQELAPHDLALYRRQSMRLKKIDQAFRHLRQNLNKKLVLDNLFSKL